MQSSVLYFEYKTFRFFVLQWVSGMHEAGADQYTFHVEATDEPEELIRKIHETGMKVRTKRFNLQNSPSI